MNRAMKITADNLRFNGYAMTGVGGLMGSFFATTAAMVSDYRSAALGAAIIGLSYFIGRRTLGFADSFRRYSAEQNG